MIFKKQQIKIKIFIYLFSTFYVLSMSLTCTQYEVNRALKDVSREPCGYLRRRKQLKHTQALRQAHACNVQETAKSEEGGKVRGDEAGRHNGARSLEPYSRRKNCSFYPVLNRQLSQILEQRNNSASNCRRVLGIFTL